MDYRKMALGLGAFVGGTAALLGGAVVAEAYARQRQGRSGDRGGGHEGAARDERDDATIAPAGTSIAGSAEHVPTDLMGDHPPGAGERATTPFRPDMDAPMTPAEREALRPATGPGPSLVTGIPNIAESVPRHE